MSIKRLSGAGLTTPKSSKLWDQTTFQSGMFALATVTLTTSASTVTFTNIPQNYTHLQIRGIARSTRSDQNGSFGKIQVGGSGSVDTATNYSWHFANGNGSGVGAVGRANESWIEVDRWSTSLVTANTFGAVVIDIFDYTSTSKSKTFRYFGGYDGNGNGESYIGSGVWRNSSTAINTISITEGSGNMVQYSQFALYGIKVA